MQFYLNGYKPGDPFVEDPHPSVAERPVGLPEETDVLISSRWACTPTTH
jgi:phenol 2-monooxygenase